MYCTAGTACTAPVQQVQWYSKQSTAVQLVQQVLLAITSNSTQSVTSSPVDDNIFYGTHIIA
jgi:hypothetical protein